jgi:hypothetical protein
MEKVMLKERSISSKKVGIGIIITIKMAITAMAIIAELDLAASMECIRYLWLWDQTSYFIRIFLCFSARIQRPEFPQPPGKGLPVCNQSIATILYNTYARGLSSPGNIIFFGTCLIFSAITFFPLATNLGSSHFFKIVFYGHSQMSGIGNDTSALGT